jgi:hypothetical protein
LFMNFTKVHVKIKQKKSAVKKNKSAVKKNKSAVKKKKPIQPRQPSQPRQRKSIYETIARVVAARKAFKKIPQTWRRI